jgi:HD-GYP domain-containing protein (c-di-GMP phosphodiesterase class II)
MKKHAEIGAAMLDGTAIPLMNMARDIALSHHEKWSGFGYPRGLINSDIPGPARIVAVADVYDALVHERVYKPAIPESKATEIIREERGRHFDPQMTDCCLDLIASNVFRGIREQVREEVVGPVTAPVSRVAPSAPANAPA